MKKIVFILVLITASVRAQTLVVIGDTTTAGSSLSTVGNNYSYVRGPIAVPAVGMIIFDSCLLRGTNASTPTAGDPDTCSIAFYADNAGAPGSRIWIDTVIITSLAEFRKGIRTMSLSFSSGTYANIWVAFGGTTNDAASSISGHSSASTGCQTGTGGGVPPLTWPACTPSTANSYMISLWGHTEGGGAPGSTTLNLLIRKSQ